MTTPKYETTRSSFVVSILRTVGWLIMGDGRAWLTITLHAWPEYGEVDIDICSCKEFSQADAIAFAREMFQTDDVEAHFVVRGSRSLRPETPDPVRYETAMAERVARLA